MTLDEVCTVGKSLLDNYQGLSAPTSQTTQVEPIMDNYTAHSSDTITKEIVELTVTRVLDRLAALPVGAWTVAPPLMMSIGGVNVRSVSKGNVSLAFKLQVDPHNRDLVLAVGGYIVKKG